MSLGRLIILAGGLFILGAFSSCGQLPKMTIIDDPLAQEEHLTLGKTYEAKGQLDLAEREYLAAQPLAGAYLALGNLYFLREPKTQANHKKAANYYHKALVLGPAPAAANNLAWLYLQDGQLLKTAESLAVRAILEGREANLSPQEMDNFKDTLYAIRRALYAKRPGEPEPDPDLAQPKLKPQPAPKSEPKPEPKAQKPEPKKSDLKPKKEPDPKKTEREKPDLKPKKKPDSPKSDQKKPERKKPDLTPKKKADPKKSDQKKPDLKPNKPPETKKSDQKKPDLKPKKKPEPKKTEPKKPDQKKLDLESKKKAKQKEN